MHTRKSLNLNDQRVVRCRLLKSIEESPDTTYGQRYKQLAKEYREEVEQELKESYAEVLDLLEKLIEKFSVHDAEYAEAAEAVFYLTMKGDYNRYSTKKILIIVQHNLLWKH